MKLLIATHNQGKLREFAQIFADLPLQLVSLDDAGIPWEVDETGDTFEANARLKAQAYCDATGLPTLADDSGLIVDALGGEPGVLSARYGGPGLTPVQQYELVLERMRAVPPGQRQARFRCVIAFARPGHPIQCVSGDIEGEIGYGPRGEAGFGYDPIFYLPGGGPSTAELPPDEKNRISHRGVAARAVKPLIEEILREG
jgi:XTP/dITP diphosphohydrolase